MNAFTFVIQKVQVGKAQTSPAGLPESGGPSYGLRYNGGFSSPETGRRVSLLPAVGPGNAPVDVLFALLPNSGNRGRRQSRQRSSGCNPFFVF